MYLSENTGFSLEVYAPGIISAEKVKKKKWKMGEMDRLLKVCQVNCSNS